MGNIGSKTRTQKYDTILIMDFGGQYAHLITKRIREQRVYSEIISCEISSNELLDLKNKFEIKGLILSGGPSSVYEKEAPKMDQNILNLGIPVLGLCYGHQLLAHIFKGKVEKGTRKEYGSTVITVDYPKGVLKGLKNEEKVWMSHGDTVSSLPEEFEIIAHSKNCPIAAYHNDKRKIYGLQFHPEVVHTENGIKMLMNYIFDICRCETNWQPTSIIDDSIYEIKKKIGDKKAIIALSGGIDSSTATILAAKAIGKNLIAIFVDQGLMREGEPEFVEKTFTKLGVNLKLINARERFYKRLKGVIDPEEKRKIIGEEFIKVFEEVAEDFNAEYLIQGTIYPDRIESGLTKHSEKIKSHHNVAGIPTKIKFKGIIEPLRDLYKDEVREIAKSLGLPDEIIYRQPFPGPGLAVRLIGEIIPKRIELLRKADKIVTDEIEKNERLKKSLWQYFAVLTNIKSVGVKGDARAYDYVLAVRAVKSREAMTASFAQIPYEILEKISTRITNELPQISRVVYDITHKPPATIEWE
ncbi:MAG: glutamine-hydrolyzing GMP synthase [Candidatus Helarchaeota archaeon]